MKFHDMHKIQGHRRRLHLGTGFAAILAAMVAVAPGQRLNAERFHLYLEASSPAAGETVTSVGEIQLEFSQQPQMTGTRIRIISDGKPLDVGDAVASQENDKVVLLQVSQGLENGEYQVRWRAMSNDGHPVTGDFVFTVTAQAR